MATRVTVLLLIQLYIAAAQNPFKTSPTSINTTLNTVAVMTCALDEAIPATSTLKPKWNFNNGSGDTPFEEASIDGANITDGYVVSSITIPITNKTTNINGVELFCVTVSRNPQLMVPSSRSGIAYIHIQGEPGEVKHLNYSKSTNWIYFSWDEPDGLKLTNSSLNTRYKIMIFVHTIMDNPSQPGNTFPGSPFEVSTKNTFYNYTFNDSATPCDAYEMNITTQNGPEDDLVTGKTSTINFFRSKVPPQSNSSVIKASFNNSIFQAKIILDSDIQACEDSCEAYARSRDDGPHYLNSSRGLQCYSNEVILTTTTGQSNSFLQLYQSYNITAIVKNAAGNSTTTGIILFTSEDIVGAKVYPMSAYLSVKVTLSTTSKARGIFILLKKLFKTSTSEVKICENGIQTTFAEKNGNEANVIINNLSQGEYDVMILPVNESGRIMTTESGSLTAKFLLYTATIIIPFDLGKGSSSERATQELEIKDSHLAVKNIGTEEIAILLQEYSSSSGELSFTDSKFLYLNKENSRVKVEGLNDTKNVCLSVYTFTNNLSEMKRTWMIITIETTKDILTIIIGTVVASLFFFIIIPLILLIGVAICQYFMVKKRKRVAPDPLPDPETETNVELTDYQATPKEEQQVLPKESESENSFMGDNFALQVESSQKNGQILDPSASITSTSQFKIEIIENPDAVRRNVRGSHQATSNMAADASTKKLESIQQNTVVIQVQSKSDSDGMESSERSQLTNSASPPPHDNTASYVLDVKDANTETSGASDLESSYTLVELQNNNKTQIDSSTLSDVQQTSYSEKQPSEMSDDIKTEIESRTLHFRFSVEGLENVIREKTWKKKGLKFYTILEMKKRWPKNFKRILKEIKKIKWPETIELDEQLLGDEILENEQTFQNEEVLKFLDIISNLLNQYKNNRGGGNIIHWKYQSTETLGELAQKKEQSYLPYIVVKKVQSAYTVGLCYNGSVIQEYETVFDCILDWLSFNINYNFKEMKEMKYNALEEILLDIISREMFDIKLCETVCQTVSVKFLGFMWISHDQDSWV